MTYDTLFDVIGCVTVALVLALNVADAAVAALEARARRTASPDDDVIAERLRVEIDAFRVFVEGLLRALRPWRRPSRGRSSGRKRR